jgi:transposase-like protein
MKNPSPFKWRHFEADIILLCVRWYLGVRRFGAHEIAP